MHLFLQIFPDSSAGNTPSFEEIAAILAELPGMFFEMDGSFVWVDHQTSPPCQMDGMVYDRNDRLEYVEVKGACNAMQWLTLCRAISGLRDQDDVAEDDSWLTRLRVHVVDQGKWMTAKEIDNQLK